MISNEKLIKPELIPAKNKNKEFRNSIAACNPGEQ